MSEMDNEEHARRLQAAVAGRNDLIWKVFVYQCAQCQAYERIGLGIGVEGPNELREDGLFIASPFMVDCSCGHFLYHTLTEALPAPRAPRSGMRYFKVPNEWEEEHMLAYMTSAFSGDFVTAKDPTP